MTFKELYLQEKKKPTPASVWVNKMAEATATNPQTVRLWLCGARKPHRCTQMVLARVLNSTPDELFNNNKRKTK